MATKKTFIYLLPFYSNKKNLKQHRYAEEDEYKINFSDKRINIEISEINSLIEERYCLNLKSAKYTLEGSMFTNEVKEAMIHHHPRGHLWKHLQFKLIERGEVIRINLEPVDEEDYEKCIKGFLYISQQLIKNEQETNNIELDLISYFFDDNIKELKPFREYLLRKIKMAYEQGKILNNTNKNINSEQLKILKSEKELLPFLDW